MDLKIENYRYLDFGCTENKDLGMNMDIEYSEIENFGGLNFVSLKENNCLGSFLIVKNISLFEEKKEVNVNLNFINLQAIYSVKFWNVKILNIATAI